MAYLTTEDLKVFLDEREIAALKRDFENDQTDKLAVGIDYATNYITDRLGTRYDMATELAKTGADRSTTLLEVMSHIAIWKMAATYPTVQLDGKRHAFYQEAMENLTRIEKGKLLAGLPVESATVGQPVWGVSTDSELIY